MKPVSGNMCDFCYKDKVHLIRVSRIYHKTVEEDFNSKTQQWVYGNERYMNNLKICFECIRTQQDE